MNMLKASLFFLRWLCLLVLAVALASCANSPAKPSARADENNKNMAGLRPGMTTEEVTRLMGPPDKIVMYKSKHGKDVATYLYITQYIETYTSRGWDRNNYTPFIFIDDRLSGWGWPHHDMVSQRYGMDLRTTPFVGPNP